MLYDRNAKKNQVEIFLIAYYGKKKSQSVNKLSGRSALSVRARIQQNMDVDTHLEI